MKGVFWSLVPLHEGLHAHACRKQQMPELPGSWKRPC